MSNLITYARDFLASIGLMRPSSGTPITSLFSTLPGHHRILLSGLDEAGKSTLLRSHLVTNEKDISVVVGMIAHQVEAYRCGNVTFQTIDLSGCRPEPYWRMERSFLKHCDALIWVDDSADHDRLIEAREELFRAVRHQDGLRNDIPVLILANKQDNSTARTAEQIKGFYVDDYSSPLVNIPHTGEGLFEAFRWLSENVESRIKYDTGINEKVPLYDKEEEATRIIMEGLQPGHKEEINITAGHKVKLLVYSHIFTKFSVNAPNHISFHVMRLLYLACALFVSIFHVTAEPVPPVYPERPKWHPLFQNNLVPYPQLCDFFLFQPSLRPTFRINQLNLTADTPYFIAGQYRLTMGKILRKFDCRIRFTFAGGPYSISVVQKKRSHKKLHDSRLDIPGLTEDSHELRMNLWCKKAFTSKAKIQIKMNGLHIGAAP
ncbi:ADP-ribosylation factor family-domain-containing protein [Fusarium sp. MPI-SDFR-AT-0072]|nr:ADP-ribosylation factor family-domain-containing protein [Fusarium sp. MPI-SDFR-AT-0072]